MLTRLLSVVKSPKVIAALLGVIAAVATALGVGLSGSGPSKPVTAVSHGNLFKGAALAPAAKCPDGPTVRPCGPHAKGWATEPPVGVSSQAQTQANVGTAEMFDTVTVATVPANPFAVAGYTSGFWPTFGPLVQAFPRAHHVSIAINVGHDADCLDVEPLDATPGEAPGWVKRQIALGHRMVCLYTSISGMGQLKSLVAAAGVSLARVKWWCAWYRFVPGLINGCDAVQWTDTALGRNLDESTVRLDFFGPPPPPPGIPAATLQLWEKLKNSAFAVYRHNKCAHPQDKNPYCSPEASVIVTYQQKLWANGTPKRWACFGPKSTARLRKSEVCWIVRPQAAWYGGARDASKQAFDQHVCGGANGQVGLTRSCRVWQQRERYFNAKAAALVKTYS